MGISILTITFVFMVPDIREMKRIRFGDVRSRAVDLLRFSIPRVPGSVADAALLAGIPVLASHFIPVSSVAYLLVGASLLSATTLSTEPLSLVFLSKITMMQADDRHEELGKFLAYLMSAIVDVSVYFAIQLLVFTQLFLQLWVGPGILNGVGTIRLIVIGIPFYLFYTGLRSAVDAGSVTAHNTRNLAVSLTAMAIMLFGSIKFLPQHKLLDAFAISLVLTLAVTALTTKLSLRRLYGVRTQWRDSLLPIGFAIVLGLIASLFNQVGSWIWLVTFQICSGLIFLALCFYSKVGWLQYLWILAWRERIRVSTSNAVAQA
jgi:O-antigen/teichoic acid export membrane protein